MYVNDGKLPSLPSLAGGRNSSRFSPLQTKSSSIRRKRGNRGTSSEVWRYGQAGGSTVRRVEGSAMNASVLTSKKTVPSPALLNEVYFVHSER